LKNDITNIAQEYVREFSLSLVQVSKIQKIPLTANMVEVMQSLAEELQSRSLPAKNRAAPWQASDAHNAFDFGFVSCSR
jgi:hypothetical protein